MLFQETPYFLLKSGEKSIGYNLLTGKAYRLPFDLDYFCTTNIDGVNVIHAGKYLYTTNDGCKTMKKIVLKLNGENLRKTVCGVHEVNVNGKSYTYVVTKNKIYYQTTSSFLKAVR